jgi:hypothetical protein
MPNTRHIGGDEQSLGVLHVGPASSTTKGVLQQLFWAPPPLPPPRALARSENAPHFPSHAFFVLRTPPRRQARIRLAAATPAFVRECACLMNSSSSAAAPHAANTSSSSTSRRQRSLSMQGRELFNLVPSTVDEEDAHGAGAAAKPLRLAPAPAGGHRLAAQPKASSTNSFTALQESSEEEEAGSAPSSRHSSPRSKPLPALSPRLAWRPDESPGGGVAWEVYRRAPGRIPKLDLDAHQAQAPMMSMPIPEPPPMAQLAKNVHTHEEEEEEDDSFYHAAADLKGRRMHGNATKPQTHKALQQRLFNMAKRESQRQHQRSQKQEVQLEEE